MKMLYQLDIQKDDREEQIDYFLKENEFSDIEKEYAKDLIDGVNNNLHKIDEYISNNSKGWSINRISKVDLAIMRLSIYEMFYRQDIPESVSINEAVELAKKYCNDQSKAFINGVLGSIVRNIKIDKNELEGG